MKEAVVAGRVDWLGAIVTLAAVALVVLLSAPWYESTVIYGGGEPNRTADADAWQVFSAFDIVILVGAGIALVAFWLRQFIAAIAASAVILIVIVYRLIETPFEEFEQVPEYSVAPAWGAWMAAATAVVLFAVCVIAKKERSSPCARFRRAIVRGAESRFR